MLDFAMSHGEELNKKMRKSFFDDKYKWYHGQYYSDIAFDNNTYNGHQYVSLNKRGEVIGYIMYKVDRISEIAYDFQAVNFSKDALIFGADLKRVIREAFEKFQFQKIEFQVVCGNPIEHSYDKLIHNFKGRVVGIMLGHTKIDGIYYDMKLYEISRMAYLSTRDDRCVSAEYWDKEGESDD